MSRRGSPTNRLKGTFSRDFYRWFFLQTAALGPPFHTLNPNSYGVGYIGRSNRPNNLKGKSNRPVQWELATILFLSKKVNLSRYLLKCTHPTRTYHGGGRVLFKVWKSAWPYCDFFYDNIIITLTTDLVQKFYTHRRFMITRWSWSYHIKNYSIIFLRKLFWKVKFCSGLWLMD